MKFKHCLQLFRHGCLSSKPLVQYNQSIYLRHVKFRSTANVKKSNEKLSETTAGSFRPKQINELHERYLFIRTCVDFWEDLPAGVTFDTAYLDSHPGAEPSPDVPVIVALHDSPGTANDLIPILQPFCNIGYRVIALNFPGFGKTKGANVYDETTFTGSTEERTEFLNSFLATVGIESIDLLIGHGTGCNTVINYVTGVRDVDPRSVRSMALISPIGHRYCSKLKMYPAIKEFDHYWNQYPLLRFPLRHILHVTAFFKFRFLLQYPMKYRIKTMLHYSGFQYPLVQSDSSSLAFKPFPFVVTHNSNSRIVDDETMEEYRDLVGIQETCVLGVDKSLPDSYTWPAYFVFGDKDYSLDKYSGQIWLLLHNLLKDVLKKR